MKKKLQKMLDEIEKMHDQSNAIRNAIEILAVKQVELHEGTIVIRRNIRELIQREDKLTKKGYIEE